MLATIDRYLLGQVMRPMLAAILITLLAMLAERALRVIDLVLGWRGSLAIVVEMMSYLIPHYMVFALPAALFLGIMLAVARLSKEAEVDAMRAAGIGLARLTRPLMLLSLLVLVLHLVLVSHLQPYARYAYRAAAFTITNASFQTLLRPGQFITLGQTTYRVDRLSEDREQFEGIFLFSEADASGTIVITAEDGRIEDQGALVPLLLHLENGVQQFLPRPAEGENGAAAPSNGTPPLTLRFGSFTSDLSGSEPEAFRPRGDHERELTIPELIGFIGEPVEALPDGIDPWEIESELSARLVRNLSILFVPLFAVPLALSPRRAKRSYGFLIGVIIVVGYNQIISTGESLADNDELSSIFGIWLPFAAFVFLTIAFFIHSARRVPDPGKSSMLGSTIDAAVSIVAQRLPWRAAS